MQLIDLWDPPNVIITIGILLGLMTIARSRKILNDRGILVAALLGLLVGVFGHWTWLLVLLVFMISGSIATHYAYDEKCHLGLEEGSKGERGWVNVVANGGAPAVIAVIAGLTGDHEFWSIAFLAAIAVATADTFASEFGVLDHNVRMITNGEPCPQGTNGGYSPTGQKAAALGASLIGILGVFLLGVFGPGIPAMWIIMIPTIAFIGWTGCQVDSLLGAMMENRGWVSKGQVNLMATVFGTLMAIGAFQLV
jgi:uncharacterized protein (TIGR00297 family)